MVGIKTLPHRKILDSDGSNAEALRGVVLCLLDTGHGRTAIEAGIPMVVMCYHLMLSLAPGRQTLACGNLSNQWLNIGSEHAQNRTEALKPSDAEAGVARTSKAYPTQSCFVGVGSAAGTRQTCCWPKQC